eukprot:CAMPEP_0178440348 /NCGR_PEP_ID=MMETSP0689_2-20121128/36732_1 /TAXON_ID=160604 /ORGANISM="Amphidinium massartii, Strain CS-259" /LENGTH=407 /DNA_ID=CAMNT_0020063119 /DNA_START=131 /DNA_END=1351 /DNA_ORIENTATION=-
MLWLAVVALSSPLLLHLWQQSCYQASPRSARTASFFDILRQVFYIALDSFLVPLYFLFPWTRCDVHIDQTNERCLRIMAQVPALKGYPATCWLRNSWISFFWFNGVCELIFPWLRPEQHQARVKREVLKNEDGSVTALDWYAAGLSLPDDAPIFFMAPTLMGDGLIEASLRLAEPLGKAGWRCVCFVKRGGGFLSPLPLHNWEPTDFMSYDDTLEGLRVVRERYPSAFLGIGGLSAGGGWVRRYCAAGEPRYADAAFSMDGGWSWKDSITAVDEANPIIAKVLGGASAQALFRKAWNCSPEEVPKWLDLTKLSRAVGKSWSSVLEAAHVPHSKLPDLDSYYAAVPDKSANMPQVSSVPLLLLGSWRDGACPEDYWLKTDPLAGLPKLCPNIFVCINHVGPHVYRPTG